MGKKEGNKKGSKPGSGYLQGTLREEIKGKGSTDANSFLKVQYLQKLASWAVSESSIPPLAAFYGYRLASSREAFGIPPLDSSLISCQRCETILHPGYNCTIRIQKNRSKARRKETKIPSVNNIIFTCHFCSHENLKSGTPKGYRKELLSSRAKSKLSVKFGCDSGTKKNSVQYNPATPSDKKENSELKGDALLEMSAAINISPIENSPVTPSGKTGLVLSKKKRKRNGSQAAATKMSSIENSPATPSIRTYLLSLEEKRKTEFGSTNSAGAVNSSGKGGELEKSSGQSRRRRRKAWSSLKEVAGIENNGDSLDLGDRTNRIDSSLFFS